MDNSTGYRIDNAALVFGLVLMALGTLFTFDRLEILEVGEFWRYWPMGIIGYGVSLLLEPGARRWGFWVLLVGGWQLAVSMQLLPFRESLPLVLIGAGFILIGESLVKPATRSNLAEENHGR